MSKKPTKLLGLPFESFAALSGKEFHLRPARLISLYRPGDEMALTSIFLSALRLIDEFRHQVFQTLRLPKGGTIHVFTEVEFLLHKQKRVDGLIVIVKGKKIVNAALVEVKNKNIELDSDQIESYATIARDYGISTILTISNQFVSFPTQSPVKVKIPKSVAHYHMSWSYVLTIAHILLYDNDTNIDDRSRGQIMQEVVSYLEEPKSGVLGFTQMKPGWTDVVSKISNGASLTLTDAAVEDAVSGWLEEERDMALILSRELGLIVHSGKKKFRSDLSARVDHEKRNLIENHALTSTLRIDGAAGDVEVSPDFSRKTVEMSVTLEAPARKNTRPQITWLRNQIKACAKKNAELFAQLQAELWVDVDVKYGKKPIRVALAELEHAHEQLGAQEIKSFGVVQAKHLGRTFESRRRFVDAVEGMLMKYYRGIVQHLRRWEKPVPQLPGSARVSEDDKAAPATEPPEAPVD